MPGSLSDRRGYPRPSAPILKTIADKLGGRHAMHALYSLVSPRLPSFVLEARKHQRLVPQTAASRLRSRLRMRKMHAHGAAAKRGEKGGESCMDRSSRFLRICAQPENRGAVARHGMLPVVTCSHALRCPTAPVNASTAQLCSARVKQDLGQGPRR